MKAIKAAAVQAAPVYLNLDASIAKAAEIVSEAARVTAPSWSHFRRPSCRATLFSCGLAHPSREFVSYRSITPTAWNCIRAR